MVYSAAASESVPAPSADWTVTGPCSDPGNRIDGYIKMQDGNITIENGGCLTVIDGGIAFVQDTSNIYHFTVNPGGTLVMENSVLTTHLDQIYDYPKLDFFMNGEFHTNDSLLKFPGRFESNGGVISLWRTTITGYTDLEINPFISLPADDNDDAPIMTFTSSVVDLYDSRVEKLYEYDGANPSWQNITLLGNTRFTAVNTFVGIDYDNFALIHNAIWAGDASRAFLYNMTIQEPYPNAEDRVPALVPVGGGEIFIYRWLEAQVEDARGVPVQGANVTAYQPPPISDFARYPDNGGSTVPSSKILQYLGKTAADFNVTGPDGEALIPLLSEWVNESIFDPTTPNSQFEGSYLITAEYQMTDYTTEGMSFDPYPALTATNNTMTLALRFPSLFLPLPDLTPTSIQFSDPAPFEGDNITVNATISNVGAGGATGILVVFEDVGPTTTAPIGNTTIPFIPGGGSVVTPPIPWNNLVGGDHSVKVTVDPPPPGSISELDEGNNTLAEFITVAINVPDLVVDAGDVSFQCPSCPAGSGYVGNPVTIRATVRNEGPAPASNVLVSFYIDDPVLGNLIGTYTVGSIPAGGAGVAPIDHTFASTGSEDIYVWVDRFDAIVESNETNNIAFRTIIILPVSNLAVSAEDLWVVDPCTDVGDQVVPRALVSNDGLIPSGPFDVSFYVEGNLLSTEPVAGIAAGYSVVVTSSVSWISLAPGPYTVRVVADSSNAVVEGEEGDNTASAQFVVHAGVPLPPIGDGTLVADWPVIQSREIAGNLTLTGMYLNVTHSDPVNGRFYLKVLDGGTLTLDNATITTRYGPLTVCVEGSGRIVSKNGGGLFLDDPIHGDGLLYTREFASLDVSDGMISADVRATGLDVSLRNVTLSGDLFYILTANTSYIWDVDMAGVVTLGLKSDDGDATTTDFDIRNVTFDSLLDAQLRFSGDQWVEITSGSTYVPIDEDWWTGMLTANAKASRYWWLEVWAVDGTDSLLANGEADITITRLNYDLTYFTDPIFPLNLPEGSFIYRAIEQERKVQPEVAWANATNFVNGSAIVGAQSFWPDANWSGAITGDTLAILKFSDLTPDFYVNSITILGDNVVPPTTSQPVDRPLTITVEVCNAGNIDTTGVDVHVYTGSTLLGAAQVAVGAAACTDAPLGWTPHVVGSFTLTAIIDENNTKRETDETNNTGSIVLAAFSWPDLDITPSDVFFVAVPAHGAPTVVSIIVRNQGRGAAVDVQINLTDNRSDVILPTGVPSINPNSNGFAETLWTPGSSGPHALTVCVDTGDGGISNMDYEQANNCAIRTVDVLSMPDLEVVDAGGNITLPTEITQDEPFNVLVRVFNVGGSIAEDFSIGLYDGTRDVNNLLGTSGIVTIGSGSDETVVVPSKGISVLGAHSLLISVDDNETISESREDNNNVTIAITVAPQEGYISIQMPEDGSEFELGNVAIVVSGTIRTGTSNNPGPAIAGAAINIEVLNADGSIVQSDSNVSDANGRFFSIDITPNWGAGDYTLRVSTTLPAVTEVEISISVKEVRPWWDQDFLGLKVWMWLLIVLLIIAAVIGLTAYVYIFGLGKLVECGECGAFIPEASTSCPKCGVEFEVDTAKCSSCSAWIPVDVKSCPECGVEFATGEVEMEDYREKMRMQYDEVVQKFRDSAEAELGHTVTDEEFKEWWKGQPTFVTFEDWLREEEEMRKMGSRPCLQCGTLNSITATICHKCGEMLEEGPEEPPGEEPPEAEEGAEEGPEEAEARPAPTPPPMPPVREAAPERVVVPKPVEPVPKKVLKRPVAPVPKKVVKKVPAEREEEEEEPEETAE